MAALQGIIPTSALLIGKKSAFKRWRVEDLQWKTPTRELSTEKESASKGGRSRVADLQWTISTRDLFLEKTMPSQVAGGRSIRHNSYKGIIN